MKLFSWMHRTLQKDNKGSFKCSIIGSSCLFLKQEYENQDYLKKFKDEKTEEKNETKPSDEIFPGFLTIGTLSVEALTDPPTPTFDMPYQGSEAEAIPEMSCDLKIISDELDKFLKDEAAGCESSDMKSSVSLIDKEKEQGKNKLVTVSEYPLQGYFLASSTETSEAKPKAKQEKSSLKKLLNKSTIALRNSRKSAEDIHKESRKLSKSPTMEKLKMIKRLFPKKIHPQASTDITDPNQFSEHNSKAIHKNSDYNSQKRNSASCWKDEDYHSKVHVNLSQEANSIKIKNAPLKELSDGEGREHWINTDEDYLVLEL